jgi:hypothetical protein
MSDTQFETYNIDEDGSVYIYDIYWIAQTFTIGNVGPNLVHKITSVKLYLKGAAATLYNDTNIGIRNTDSNSKPTGSNLGSGTIPTGTITTTTSWYEVTISPSVIVKPNTMYAIIVSVPTGTVLNRLEWRCDGSSPTYTGGTSASSSDSGGTWTLDGLKDLYFYEYGISSINTYLVTRRY